MPCVDIGGSTLAVMTTTLVVSGSVSARAFSSMNRFCGERIDTSLRYGLVRPRLCAVISAVVERAEKAGKEVKPLIVPTYNPLHAILQTAKDIQAHEVIMGASNKYTTDEQLEQIAFYWISLHHGETAPLTVRILSRDRDMYLDLAGGNRIPKVSERARTIEELRAAGVGVDRVLLTHDGSPACSDLFQGVLTMLDPQVRLGLVSLIPPGWSKRAARSASAWSAASASRSRSARANGISAWSCWASRAAAVASSERRQA